MYSIYNKFGGLKKFWSAAFAVAAIIDSFYSLLLSSFIELHNQFLLENIFFGLIGAALVFAGASTYENIKTRHVTKSNE